MKWKKLLPIIATVGLITVSNCKNPGKLAFSSGPEFELDVVKIISYEVESVTTRIEEGESTSELSQLRAMPVIDRSAIFYGIDEAGETEIFIDILEPKQQLPKDDIPPNDYQKMIKHIHVVRGTGYFFDRNRKLVTTQSLDGSNMAPIDNLKTSKVDIEIILKQAEEMGAIIHDLGNGFVSIRMGANQINNSSAGRISGNYPIEDESYAVTIFNKITQEPIGVSIYDLSDRLLFRMYAQSETSTNGELILKATQQEVYDLDPVTNKTTIIKTTNEYSNYTIEAI